MAAKILIVDDSATDRMIIQSMLSEYETILAKDGLEALAAIEKDSDIDLVILDLNMPNMDGFQFIQAIKEVNAYRNLRIIILTNYDELENEIKGLLMGAVDYIRKPIQMETLKLRIEIHLRQREILNEIESNLEEKSITFDSLFNNAPIGITISYGSSRDDDNKEHALINSTFEKITGRSKEELLMLGWGEITHPDDLKEELPKYRMLMRGEIDGYSMDKRYIKPDGTYVWVHIVVSSLNPSKGEEFNHICLIQDISRRKSTEMALQESERAKSVLLSHLPGMAYRSEYDPNWSMRFISQGCERLTGYKPEDIIDNAKLAFSDLITEEYRIPLREKWASVIREKGIFEYEYEITTANGERRWVLEMGEGVYNDEGEVEALEGIILDISQRKKIEDSFKYQSEHDEITGLYNLRYLERLLKEELANEEGTKKAVVGINLSAIQAVTKSHGFHYAHELSRRIAEALSFMSIRGRRILFNAYSSNFIYYIKNYDSQEDLIDFCEDVSEKLSSVLAIERITGGIGIVEISDYNREDVQKILRNVLIASEQAVNAFEKDFAFRFYTEGLELQLIREEKIKHELVRIVEMNDYEGFHLHYQPIIDIRDNTVSGFEALARMQTQDLGVVSPLEFIPIAEKTKLIIPLGEMIIMKAFEFLRKIKEEGHIKSKISINISVIQLLREGFVEGVFRIMDKVEISPEDVILELTESVFGINNDDLNDILASLRDAGIQIAIDDFGTGYSSLARERELSVSCLKIDKSFIDRLMFLEPDRTITSDIISMGHKLGHYVVAEGVEHQEQMEYLEKCGCDMIQGYLISRPLDEESAMSFIDEY
jgi:PAS domain S-box-containing protein